MLIYCYLQSAGQRMRFMIDLHFYGLLATTAAATQEHNAHPPRPAIKRRCWHHDLTRAVRPAAARRPRRAGNARFPAGSTGPGRLLVRRPVATAGRSGHRVFRPAIPAKRPPRPRPGSAMPGPTPRCGRPCCPDERRSAVQARSLGQPSPGDRTRRSDRARPPPRRRPRAGLGRSTKDQGGRSIAFAAAQPFDERAGPESFFRQYLIEFRATTRQGGHPLQGGRIIQRLPPGCGAVPAGKLLPQGLDTQVLARDVAHAWCTSVCSIPCICIRVKRNYRQARGKNMRGQCYNCSFHSGREYFSATSRRVAAWGQAEQGSEAAQAVCNADRSVAASSGKFATKASCGRAWR